MLGNLASYADTHTNDWSLLWLSISTILTQLWIYGLWSEVSLKSVAPWFYYHWSQCIAEGGGAFLRVLPPPLCLLPTPRVLQNSWTWILDSGGCVTDGFALSRVFNFCENFILKHTKSYLQGLPLTSDPQHRLWPFTAFHSDPSIRFPHPGIYGYCSGLKIWPFLSLRPEKVVTICTKIQVKKLSLWHCS